MHNLGEELVTLEPKIPIKNLHLVRSLLLHNNTEILVVFDSTIQFHSLPKLIGNLPSLIYVLDIAEISNRIGRELCQDELSHKISTEPKTKFGEIIFTTELNPSSNILLQISTFRSRARYLSSSVTKIHEIQLHELGHLLITLEDRRCFILPRRIPHTPTHPCPEGEGQLYDVKGDLLINESVKGQVVRCVFVGVGLDVICVHGEGMTGISKIGWKQGQGEASLAPLMASGKKVVVNNRGLMNMSYVPHSTGGWVLLLYFNRLEVVEMGFSAKSKTMQLISHKEADFSHELEKEHIINFYKSNELQSIENSNKVYKYHLQTRFAVWLLEITLKSANNTNSWTFTLKKLGGNQPQFSIYFINNEGNYLSSVVTHNNNGKCMAVETNNGIIFRLQSCVGNYKEGYIIMSCMGRGYMARKMGRCVREKEGGERGWVGFGDLAVLKKHAGLRKELLKELTDLGQKEESEWHDVLVINALHVLESKKEIVEKLQEKRIKRKLGLGVDVNYDRSHCCLTNSIIKNENVAYCEVCELYCIKSAGILCCYICWNLLCDIEN